MQGILGLTARDGNERMGEMVILPDGRKKPLEAGKTILAHLREAAAPVTAHCGGRGECRACTVTVGGEELLSPRTSVEESVLRGDPRLRLACQAVVERTGGTLTVELPRYPRYSIVERGLRPPLRFSPSVRLSLRGDSPAVAWGDR